IQEKVLALEDPVSKFIPEFLTGAKREATLLHLLNHGSGLPDWKPYYQEIIRLAEKEPGYLGSSSAKTRVYKMAHDEPLISFPGEKSLYSDIGFILLGDIVEKTGGEPLHRFCYRHIFSKLKTRETFFIPRGRTPRLFRGRTFAATEACPWRGEIVRGAVHDDNAYAMGGVAGHAGLFSTAREVYRLVRLWLDSVEGAGRFDPALASLFVTKQKGKGVPPSSSWGLGWDTPSRYSSSSGRFFSSLTFGHLGFTGTSIWVDRKRDLGVILLTNRVHPSRENQRIKLFRPELHDLIFQEVALDASAAH
ncbi:MAG TPA: serine hydrolase domain-containing protein, partial [Candidatus Manganitrophaceae bacterium]